MNPDPNLNPNRNNPSNLLDTIILLDTTLGSGYCVKDQEVDQKKLSKQLMQFILKRLPAFIHLAQIGSFQQWISNYLFTKLYAIKINLIRLHFFVHTVYIKSTTTWQLKDTFLLHKIIY